MAAKVTCPFCKRRTGMDRDPTTSGHAKGCYTTFICDHCGERIVYQTYDHNGRKTGRVIDLREKIW